LSSQKNFRIFFSNIGYAKGINGCLQHHLLYSYRHLYCPADIQKKVFNQINAVIEKEDPDLCCFVEIEQGMLEKIKYNEHNILLSGEYKYFDLENKYGRQSWLRNLPWMQGKSNAFMSKTKLPYEKIFFEFGIKRLVYKIHLSKNITIFFAHFSLKESVRQRQLQHVKKLFKQTKGEIIFLGDFNILTGLKELEPLFNQSLILINDPTKPTFTFHKSSLLLDLCLCSKEIAPYLSLTIHPQPYSDHAALIVDIKDI
jgi:hypothetical protein